MHLLVPYLVCLEIFYNAELVIIECLAVFFQFHGTHHK